MKNLDIYTNYKNLYENFHVNEKYYTIDIMFPIAYNLQQLKNASEVIESVKKNIISQNGKLLEDGKYEIPQDKINYVNTQLEKLQNQEQDVSIKKICYSDLKGCDFTFGQMQALIFMINTPSEEEELKEFAKKHITLGPPIYEHTHTHEDGHEYIEMN